MVSLVRLRHDALTELKRLETFDDRAHARQRATEIILNMLTELGYHDVVEAYRSAVCE